MTAVVVHHFEQGVHWAEGPQGFTAAADTLEELRALVGEALGSDVVWHGSPPAPVPALVAEVCAALARGDYRACEAMEDRIARDPDYLVEEEEDS